MANTFKVNASLTYSDNSHVSSNIFLAMPCENESIPDYETLKSRLPLPIWEGHESVLSCYEATWKLAFAHVRQADPKAGFVSNFIDTAFNGYLFMWDSAFIVQYGRYGRNAFDFQKTLDNFYARQHRDGFICRELCEDIDGDQFQRDDPSSTGPNILPWAEWESYKVTGDLDRMAKVFDPLIGYHRWLSLNRTWPNGAYWSTGWGSGMDNQPRLPEGYDVSFSHGHMIWQDACSQMLLSGKILIEMGKLLGREKETSWLKEEVIVLKKLLNDQLWDDREAFFYDRYKDGSLNRIKSIGAYWALLTDEMPKERIKRFVAHLEDPKQFNRKHRVPSLSADDPHYQSDGGYWLGSVWAPTTYMVLQGLRKHGYEALAYEIASNTLENVVKVYHETGTLWENYAPESANPGSPAKPDFVGWTGLVPIAILFEFVFGITARGKSVTWRIHRLERHGILQYPILGGTVDLVCEARSNASDRPAISIKGTTDAMITVIYNDGQEPLEFRL